ncbi:Sulfite reductase (NADPH) hemoprotein beta-component [Candidatus Magnetaquicoccaceae bacterium FCR-1]|uniref:Sulfite reductase (NADPH) hemoprotein beta-component n=1 Tax=Candidatus Magnetaquiglobus chichijimensis TaxID=3141448 RepID=A0ABQ0C5G9_9PROT
MQQPRIQAVMAEIDRLDQAVNLFEQGALSEDRFLALRMSLGVYTQRTQGAYMVRLKLPGGRITPGQMVAVADRLERLPHAATIHLTTRQDMQLKPVFGDRLVELLRGLHQDGLCTGEAGGPTVRNIVACPMAGICPMEERDVLPIVDGLKERYLGNPLTRFLPRKFKIAVSGCAAGCAQEGVHDLGITACRDEDGQGGYRVSMGGGLGHKPRQARVIEPWVAESELFPVVEAVLRVHHRYSDREKKSRARLKFLWERFDEETVLGHYQEALTRTRRIAGFPNAFPGAWSEVSETKEIQCAWGRETTPQRQPGLWSVPVRVPLGDLTPSRLRGLGALAGELGLSEVRVTTDMNLLMVGVPVTRALELEERLTGLGLSRPRVGEDVTACVGSEVCNLGLTAAPLLARQLTGGVFDLKVRVSGCPNGCVHSDVCDIGLSGEIRRPHGIPLPFYRLLVGGLGSGSGLLGRCIASIPATRAPRAVARIQKAFAESGMTGDGFSSWIGQQNDAALMALVGDLEEITPDEATDLAEFEQARCGFELKTGLNECMGSRRVHVEMAFSRAAHERDCCHAHLEAGEAGPFLKTTREILTGLGVTLLAPTPMPVALTELSLEQLAVNAMRKPALTTPLVEAFTLLTERQRQLEQGAEWRDLTRFLTDLDRWIGLLAEQWCREDPTLYLIAYLSASFHSLPMVDDGNNIAGTFGPRVGHAGESWREVA